MSLERFHEARASRSADYDTALAEIRGGHVYGSKRPPLCAR